MIENIRGLKIKGKCFSADTLLSFFQNQSDRISIVYGKNGSGKSTVSEGFQALNSSESDADVTASLIGENNIMISNMDPTNNVFIFNEKYVDQNIKIASDGLGSIVLLGGQVDIQSEIENYTKLQEEANRTQEELSGVYQSYLKSDNPTSPQFHFERMRGMLKQSGGWAETDSNIKGLRRNSSVTDDTIREIGAIVTADTISILQQKFSQTKELLQKVSNSDVTYPTKIATFQIKLDNEQHICELLSKKIEEPRLTEREQQILNAVRMGRQSSIESARNDFNDPDTKVCPYCYQSIDDAYKKELISNINRVLSKEVDAHKADLKKIQISSLEFDIEQYRTLDFDLTQKIQEALDNCNKMISEYILQISLKFQNVFTPISIVPLGLHNAIGLLNEYLLALEEKRKEFILAAQKVDNLQKELLEINKAMAHLTISPIYKDFIKQTKLEKLAKDALLAQQPKTAQITTRLETLQQQKANIALAIENINNALDYVFFTRGRLSIELKNNKYCLKANGKNVLPKNVSLGERNIIALCYFFTQILANQEISKLYKNEVLVVIDDPISSFDFENKVGVLSFLRYQISRIISGNNNSKAIILSHDLATVFDLQKAMDEVCKATKGNSRIANTDYSWLELSNGNLKRFLKSRSEYAELLQLIYSYIQDENANDINIGNTMRRALEAFSTFTYRKSVHDVSCDANVLKDLGKKSVYFENLMYRLILHNESHYEEQVYNSHDNMNFYHFISDAEKKRTAQDVLCFMHLLNPNHVVAYLGSTSKALEKISSWAQSIPDNDSFEIQEKPITVELPEGAHKIIPLYDCALSAGTGAGIFDGDIPSTKHQTANTSCDFALRVEGDSMEPDIQDNSIVLIRKCEEINIGTIGAFFYDGRVYCKKYMKDGEKVSLESINPKYSPIIVLNDSLYFYGEVVGIESC